MEGKAMTTSLTPAYGNDYKSIAEVLAAWNDEQDFKMQPSGQYINKRDALKYDGPTALYQVHYAKLQKTFIFTAEGVKR